MSSDAKNDEDAACVAYSAAMDGVMTAAAIRACYGNLSSADHWRDLIEDLHLMEQRTIDRQVPLPLGRPAGLPELYHAHN